jgi:hypothetical protein
MYLCILLSASAVADTDFINTTSTSLDFAVASMPGDTHCINVTINEDSALEGDETFNVALMLTTSDPNVVLGTDMTTITITDNDSECVCVYVCMYYCMGIFIQSRTCGQRGLCYRS